jgi:hypothetical protein
MSLRKNKQDQQSCRAAEAQNSALSLQYFAPRVTSMAAARPALRIAARAAHLHSRLRCNKPRVAGHSTAGRPFDISSLPADRSGQHHGAQSSGGALLAAAAASAAAPESQPAAATTTGQRGVRGGGGGSGSNTGPAGPSAHEPTPRLAVRRLAATAAARTPAWTQARTPAWGSAEGER